MAEVPPQPFHNRCEAAARWLSSSCCDSCHARRSSQYLARPSLPPHYFPPAVTGAGEEKKKPNAPVALRAAELLRTLSHARVVANRLTGLTKSLLMVHIEMVVEVVVVDGAGQGEGGVAGG